MFPHLPNKHWFFFFFTISRSVGNEASQLFNFYLPYFFIIWHSSNEEFIFLRFSIIPKQRSPKLDYEWTRNDAVNSLRTTSFSRLLVTLIDDRLFRLIAPWIASSLPRCIILENYLSLSARSVHGSFIAYANNQNLIETLCPVKLPRSPIKKKKKKILTPWDRATNYKSSPTLLHVDRIINTPIRDRRETSFRIFSSILNSIWNERESPVFRIHNFWKLFVLSSLSFTLSFSLQLKLKQLKRRKKWIGASLIFSLSYIKILSLSNKCWSPHFAGLSIVTSETITIMKFLWEIYPKLLIQCFR